MGFSISDNGKVITQSGHDTNFTGLSIISEVEKTYVGSGTSQKRYYNLGSRRLAINGTLTHEPANEVLIIDEDIANQSIVVNGTYNFGVVTTFDGYGQPDVATGIIITRKTNSNYGNPVFEVTNNGTFNWNGAHMQTAGTIYFKAGSTVNITNGSIEIENDSSGQLIRSFTSSLSVNGLRKIGGGFILYTPPALFSGYVPIHSDLSPQASGRNDYSLLFYGNSERIDIRDFSGYGNPVEIGYIDNGQARLINSLNGSETTFNGWLGTGNDRSDCYIDIVKEISLNFKDFAGNAVDAKTYVVDDDSGNRKNQNGNNNISDKVYDVNSTNGSSDLTLIIGIVNVLDGVDPALVDVRFNNDIANLKFINYEYLLSSTNISVKGNGVYGIDWIMFKDLNISETDKTVVDAYTTLETSAKVYDKTKSYLYDNYEGEVETLVNKDGNQIVSNLYDFIINKTTTVPFNFYNSGIQIKADVFNGGVTSANNILLANGASLNNCVIDGDLHIQTGVDTIKQGGDDDIGVEEDLILEFSNVTVTGLVYNDSVNNTLTINANNSTLNVAVPGVGNGETKISQSATFTVTGLKVNSEVRLYSSDLSTEIGGVENSGTSESFVYTQSYTDAVLVVHNIQYNSIRVNIDLSLVDSTLPVQQQFDRNYKN